MKKDITLEGSEIILTLDNQVLIEKLNDFKEDLMTFLRTRLKNGEIYLSHKISDKPKEDLLYTSQEKFNYLAKKHPILGKLKNALGLDTNF